MNRLLFLASTGAKETDYAVQATANNIANASTDGFKADVHQFRSIMAKGHGHEAKAYTLSESPGISSARGSMNYTGEPTDLTVKGQGWMVFDLNGQQYLRQSASLTVDMEGMVRDVKGGRLLTDNGPLQLPEYEKIHFGKDGRISVQPIGATVNQMEQLGQVLITNPPASQLVKGTIGEVAIKGGAQAQAAPGQELLQGVREGSNVNSVSEMAKMMMLQSHFAQQQAVMKTASEQSNKSNSLIRMN